MKEQTQIEQETASLQSILDEKKSAFEEKASQEKIDLYQRGIDAVVDDAV